MIYFLRVVAHVPPEPWKVNAWPIGCWLTRRYNPYGGWGFSPSSTGLLGATLYTNPGIARSHVESLPQGIVAELVVFREDGSVW